MTSPPPPQPSYEELAAVVVELKLLVAAQAEQIAELERRLAADSRNSSKPPSSDGLRKKPAPRSLRKATGRKPGRAKGDPGGRLDQVAGPDAIIDHYPAACGGCGNGLVGVVSAGYRARQVFELPEIRPEVTEHRLHRAVCGCGHATTAPTPEQVPAATVYGAGIRAAVCCLSAYQHLPAKRLAEAMGTLFGLPMSTGTVMSVLSCAHDGLEDFEDQVKAHLAAAPVAHADESGVRVAGRLHWLHVMCTHLVTFYDKTQRNGCRILAADRWFPSSKTCSGCGAVKAKRATAAACADLRMRRLRSVPGTRADQKTRRPAPPDPAARPAGAGRWRNPAAAEGSERPFSNRSTHALVM